MKIIIAILLLCFGCHCSPQPAPQPVPPVLPRDAGRDAALFIPADATASVTPSDATGPETCLDNMCGSNSYCSCHGMGNERRCWSLPDDCKFDAQCCFQAGTCHGTHSDDCVNKTIDNRRALMKKAAQPTAGKP